jgi:hypothetical protein
VSPVPECTVESKTGLVITHFSLFTIAFARKQGHQEISFAPSAVGE